MPLPNYDRPQKHKRIHVCQYMYTPTPPKEQETMLLYWIDNFSVILKSYTEGFIYLKLTKNNSKNTMFKTRMRKIKGDSLLLFKVILLIW